MIASAASREPYFVQEFSHPQITLVDMPGKFTRVESHLINLRQYFLMNPSLGATLNHKNEVFRRERPRRYWFARAVNSVLGAFRRYAAPTRPARPSHFPARSGMNCSNAISPTWS